MNSFPPDQSNPYSCIFKFGGGLVLVTSVIFMFTNPSSQKYEEFATEQLVIYAKENVCSSESANLEQIIKNQVCNLLLDTGRAKIPNLVAQNTQRQNFLLFSVYETNLYLYEFQTIGVFNEFHVIDVHKIR